MTPLLLVALLLTASLILPAGMLAAARLNNPPDLPEGGTP